MCVLGAITEDGRRLFSWFTEYVTVDNAKHIILILCKRFIDDTLVMVDGAPHLLASTV